MLTTERAPKLSKRRRRVLWTSAIAGAALLFGSVFLVRAYRARHAPAYKPGEANSDITESLARDLPRDAPKPVFADVTVLDQLAEIDIDELREQIDIDAILARNEK